ncbi:MmcQ/YjbR family DNA-binding protein [Crocinitomicaceae bacterium CZZ-1]|uniref:MmcQ/YjbR family DNA-binding protein n=1 Tax=Taishania pollutisoli TaxID=2766479 RepID=A0A8J6TYS1_9FLAO|nr:MmcQ/YjbR family DNA-binding protein [Taishania pollutisoli]MBC9811273.1 MmcQ/YjbR family DNA-binding protein [Taishania pollutisoli]MBX2947812.1 MmcQ/YjbR family DNA-binding protein [Crocinitomicaceae bacterium]NGF75056.1 MmcQ/YjbR family DNA-binding protein [Fluviicola sp. SGL-29]
MYLEEIRDYCLSKKGTEETFPFDATTLVFKVFGKMYALIDIDEARSINLKCDPERAEELREQYDGIIPGYHMSKKHWNTVSLDGSINRSLVIELIDHSYDLVYASLPKKLRNELEN